MKKITLLILLVCFKTALFAQTQIICNHFWYDDVDLPKYDFKNYESRQLHNNFKYMINHFPIQQIWSINNTKFFISAKTLGNVPQNARILIKLDNGSVIKAIRQQTPVAIQDTASVFYSIPQINQMAVHKIVKIRIEFLYLTYKDFETTPQQQEWLLQGFKKTQQVLKQQFLEKSKLKNNFSAGF